VPASMVHLVPGQPSAPRERAAPRRLRRVALALGAVVVLGLAADAVWAGATAFTAFREARDELVDAGVLLVAGDIEGADVGFAAAAERAARASSALGHPGISLLGLAPKISDDVDAARRGATASIDAAEGGLAYVAAARAAGWDGQGVPGFGSGGRIDTGVIAAAAPDVARAADLLERARAELAPVDAEHLAGPLSTLMADAQAETAQRAEQAAKASTLASVLPGFLGGDEPRTYLLVTLTPSDPRGSGGYPGVYGLLRTDGERLRLDELAPTSTIPIVDPIEAPPEVRRNYGRFGALTTFWATTYTPDFPTAAGLMKGIWESGGGEPIDGVIAGDLRMLADVLGVVGPVDTPVWPETITSDNAERILGADVYMTTDGAQADAWQVGIGDALWRATLTRPWPAAPMVSALSSATAGRHLQIWTNDPAEQAAFELLGATGAVRFADGDVPLVTLNGITANRAGYYAQVEVSSAAQVGKNGSREVTVTVTIENEAPSGPPSILLGADRSSTAGYPIGTFGTQVSVYLPEGGELVTSQVDGAPSLVLREETEFGRTSVTQLALVRPGSASSVVVVYRVTSEE